MQNKFQIIFSYFSYHSKFRCDHFIFSEAPTIQMTNNVTEGDLWKIKWNVTFPGADNIESVIITYKEKTPDNSYDEEQTKTIQV